MAGNNKSKSSTSRIHAAKQQDRKTPRRAMAQPSPRVTVRSVRAQADAVISACDAMERPPADVKVVAKMSVVAKEISSLLGHGIQSEELGHRAQAEAQSQLVRCEKGLRSLKSTVSAASASARRANRAGTEEDASELRSRAAAEQQLMQQIYNAFASLGQSTSVDADGELRRLAEGMEDLGRLAGEARGKFSSTGSGEQNNYVNESTGTQNNNRDSRAPVYFGQNMSFYRED